MNNKIRLSVVLVLGMGAGVATWRYFSPSLSEAPETLNQPTVEIPAAGAGVPGGLSAEGVSEEQLARLLSDPRVETYFQREKDKQALREYFSDNGGELSSEEIWQLIESIEAEGRVMAYEAMALKLAWLERNSANKAEFDQAAQGLIESYRQKAEQSAREYDPYEDVPGFAEYKEEERRIIAEVQQMTAFPDGMNKQQYLRKRLQAAREKAYSTDSDQ